MMQREAEALAGELKQTRNVLRDDMKRLESDSRLVKQDGRWA